MENPRERCSAAPRTTSLDADLYIRDHLLPAREVAANFRKKGFLKLRPLSGPALLLRFRGRLRSALPLLAAEALAAGGAADLTLEVFAHALGHGAAHLARQ